MHEDGSTPAHESSEDARPHPDHEASPETPLEPDDDATTRLTEHLVAAAAGDQRAMERLWSRVNSELRVLARSKLAWNKPVAALDSMDLVNEFFLRITRGVPMQWANRRHFFCTASKVMRQILIDHWRKSLVQEGHKKLLPHDAAGDDRDFGERMAICEALERLAARDRRKADVVSLRYVNRLTIEEIATALDISATLVKNEWRFAKAWLHRELHEYDVKMHVPEE